MDSYFQLCCLSHSLAERIANPNQEPLPSAVNMPISSADSLKTLYFKIAFDSTITLGFVGTLVLSACTNTHLILATSLFSVGVGTFGVGEYLVTLGRSHTILTNLNNIIYKFHTTMDTFVYNTFFLFSACASSIISFTIIAPIGVAYYALLKTTSYHSNNMYNLLYKSTFKPPPLPNLFWNIGIDFQHDLKSLFTQFAIDTRHILNRELFVKHNTENAALFKHANLLSDKSSAIFRNAEKALDNINNISLLNHETTHVDNDNLSLTPLGSAILNDNLKIVELLIKKGVDLDYVDAQGNTPLAFANSLLDKPGNNRNEIAQLINNSYIGKITDTLELLLLTHTNTQAQLNQEVLDPDLVLFTLQDYLSPSIT